MHTVVIMVHNYTIYLYEPISAEKEEYIQCLSDNLTG